MIITVQQAISNYINNVFFIGEQSKKLIKLADSNFVGLGAF